MRFVGKKCIPHGGHKHESKSWALLKKQDCKWIGLQWLLLWAILIVSYFASPYFILVSFVDVQVGNICVIGFEGFQFAQSKPPCSLFYFLGFR
jgi:hypothetical protein